MIKNKNLQLDQDDYNFKSLFIAIWQNKILIILITLLSAICSIHYSLSLPNFYTSTTLLAPVEQKMETGALRTFAKIAGANVDFGDQYNKTDYGLELIYSSKFLEKFIIENKIKPEIMAVKNWNKASKKIVFDPEIYDSKTKKWKIKPKSKFQLYVFKIKSYILNLFKNNLPESDIGSSTNENITNTNYDGPSLQQTVKELRTMINVTKNQKNGFVIFSITHQSPFLAKKWTESLINNLNSDIRSIDIKESKLLIKYLEEQIASTSLKELRLIFYALIKKQTEKIMLAEIRKQYVFKVIDPPIVPELKSKPSRSSICLFITFIGFFVSIVIAQLNYFIRQKT